MEAGKRELEINNQASLLFDDLYQEVVRHGPDGFCLTFEDIKQHDENGKLDLRLVSDAYDVEDQISRIYINKDFELIYRGLSWVIFIFFARNRDTMKQGDVCFIKSFDREELKAKFEKRIFNWKAKDEGFTSDMLGLQKYREANDY